MFAEKLDQSKIQQIVSLVTERNDVVLAFFLVLVVFMMILPMPTFLVDTLVAINMTFAVILMMISIYIKTPLAFSAFPSVLLFSTLFRLALSITTTRLILLNGDAGEIITTFGNFVVGGNVVVGIVVFMIITVVQFIVITKGSERVAEVSARFALDGMPGKQMSIDGDMRAGMIDPKEAKRRRQVLEDESKLFGSMDGAMKFVKGDAIAGIVIIIINIVGGISIGSMQKGLSLGEAGHLYTILTIGDGLVAQIPALFIAITSGIIVTRVGAEDSQNLGKMIGGQILAQPNALMIGGVVSLVLGMIPGFPTTVFVFLGLFALFVGVALHVFKTRSERDGVDFEAVIARNQNNEKEALSGGLSGLAVPLAVEISEALKEEAQQHRVEETVARTRKHWMEQLGVPYPASPVFFKPGLGDRKAMIVVNDVPVREFDVPMDGWNIVGEQLGDVLIREAKSFIGTQETRKILDRLKPEYTDLLKEAEGTMPVSQIAGVLQRLVGEQISLRHIRLILDSIVTYGKNEQEPSLLSDLIRIDLAQQISHQFSGPDRLLEVLMLDQNIEVNVRKAVKKTDTGVYLDVNPQIARKLAEKVKAECAKHPDKSLVLLCAQDVRRFVRTLIEPYGCRVPVLGLREIVSTVSVKPVGRVSL